MKIPTYDEWLSEHGSEIEKEWRLIHDDYGDAAPLLSQFKHQRYQEYVYSLTSRK